MILDNELLFSDGQTVTASAASTNVLDLGAGKVGGSEIRLFVHGSDGSGEGTVTITLQSCATQGGTYVSHFTTSAVAGSAITGGQLLSVTLPADCEQFVKLAYTVSGTMSADITAGLVMDAPHHNV